MSDNRILFTADLLAKAAIENLRSEITHSGKPFPEIHRTGKYPYAAAFPVAYALAVYALECEDVDTYDALIDGLLEKVDEMLLDNPKRVPTIQAALSFLFRRKMVIEWERRECSEGQKCFPDQFEPGCHAYGLANA